MAQGLQRAWLHRGLPAALLLPLSLLFAALAGLRKGLYRSRLLRQERVDALVIVVGNVVAGGAGKTPVTAAVVHHLLESGIACGVVSRGYGRRTNDCREVLADSEAADVGDEPLLLARATGAPVYVGNRRADAARALLRRHPGTRVIVCDDGLQHLALARDVEICVFDDRGVGNGWLLPAGPLRERWPRAVDLVVRTQDSGIVGHLVTRQLAADAIAQDAARVPLSTLRGEQFAAVAAIAQPQAFFDMLEKEGLHPARTLALPDHDPIDAPLDTGGLRIVCTEKDAAKVWRWHPDALVVPLVIGLEPSFWRELDALVDAKLSSGDGSQTA